MKFIKLILSLLRPKITKLQVNENDYIVITYAEKLNHTAWQKITTTLQDTFGDKIKVIVLDNGAGIKTISNASMNGG